ncbi:hypothetical protein [Nocardia sp. NPDC050793]|uniref:hypothetical protein n=1 Tax=Nocardia sp. NPDC050793 TaxID=3155159 RepID=UPI003409141F
MIRLLSRLGILDDQETEWIVRHATLAANLVDALRKAGATQLVGELADRAASEAALDDGFDVAMLMVALREAGATEQVGALARSSAVRTVPEHHR